MCFVVLMIYASGAVQDESYTVISTYISVVIRLKECRTL